MKKAYHFNDVLPFWSILNKEEQDEIIHNAVVFSTDHKIYINSDLFPTDGPVWVTKGSVREYVMSNQGREMTLFRFYQGDSFNHSTTVFAPSDRNQRGGIIYPDTELVHIPRDTFYSIALQHPDLWNQFLSSLDDIYAKSLDILCSAVFDSVQVRLAKFLLEQSEIWNSDTIKATHENLANELGTTRVVISRELESLNELDFIQTRRGAVSIKNREALQQLCQYD